MHHFRRNEPIDEWQFVVRWYDHNLNVDHIRSLEMCHSSSQRHLGTYLQSIKLHGLEMVMIDRPTDRPTAIWESVVLRLDWTDDYCRLRRCSRKTPIWCRRRKPDVCFLIVLSSYLHTIWASGCAIVERCHVVCMFIALNLCFYLIENYADMYVHTTTTHI